MAKVLTLAIFLCYNGFMNFPTWDKSLFFALFFILAGMEFLGIFDSKYVTITGIICYYIPVWCRWMILGWLIFHFGVQHQ
jgi:hypothetical protein